MATKQFYATGALKYGTRRLQAGDPVELDASLARLYTALGKVTDKRPRAAKGVVPAMSTKPVETPPVTPAAKPKPAARKRTAKKK